MKMALNGLQRILVKLKSKKPDMLQRLVASMSAVAFLQGSQDLVL